MAIGKKTGGRKEGTPNKRTAKMRDATRRVLEDAQLRSRMDDLDAHGFMVLWYRNRDLPVELRIQAATAAARFERPALQTRLPRLASGLRSHIRMERD
jgi:hypothetical protein